MLFSSLITGALLASSAAAAPVADVQDCRPLLNVKSVKTLHTFDRQWIENIAVRRSGDVLVTSLTNSTVLQYTQATGQICTAVRFPAGLSVLGIAESATEADVFYVATNAAVFPSLSAPGGGVLHRVDLSRASPCAHPATPTAVVHFPSSMAINGVAAVPRTSKLLVTDSGAGVIWRADVKTGAVDLVLNDTTTRGAPNGTKLPGEDMPLAVAANGIKVRDGFAFFTNTNQALFSRVPIDALGKPIGPVDVLRRDTPSDDFSLPPRAAGASDKAAYLTAPLVDSVAYVDGATGFEKNLTRVVSATAALFGRGSTAEEKALYVTTNGGSAEWFAGMAPSGTLQKIVFE